MNQYGAMVSMGKDGPREEKTQEQIEWERLREERIEREGKEIREAHQAAYRQAYRQGRIDL